MYNVNMLTMPMTLLFFLCVLPVDCFVDGTVSGLWIFFYTQLYTRG